jgi:hypothetical protein
VKKLIEYFKFKRSGECVAFGPYKRVGELWTVGFMSGVQNRLVIGRLEISANRWPWQGYGWAPHNQPKGEKVLCAPLNASGARFGGGWKFKLGVSVGATTTNVDLLFGSVSFYWKKKK